MSRKQTKKKQKVSSGEWYALSKNSALAAEYRDLSIALQQAHAEATQKAARSGGSPSDYLNLAHAESMLERNPELLRYVASVAGQSSAVPSAFLAQKGSPSGVTTPQQSNATGAWAGPGAAHATDGVVNARVLRDWADSNEWVRSAINVRRQQIGRADIAVVPFNERRAYNRGLQRRIQLLLDQPNEYRQNYYELMAGCIDDILVLDRGVLLKDMTTDRKPVHLYNEDGACIKIYTEWSGDPREPRYLYESPSTNRRVPLRNDEAIVMMANPATYRFGLSPVQILRNTIQADLTATKSAMQMVDMKPPPHMIQLPGATQTQLEAIKTKYETDIAGRKEIFWVGGQTSAQAFPLVFSARDNQWLEWQVYLARKIAIVFQISPQQLGITFDINKATASSQQEIFEDTGLIPLLLLIEEYFNREILGDFTPMLPDGRSNFEALNLRILFPEITETDRQMHAERAIKLATTGLAGLPSMTLNQVLNLFGEEPVDGGNTFYAAGSMGPVPWLSYDGKVGAFGPTSTSGDEGGQDSMGGPDIDEDEPHSTNDDGSYTPPAQGAPVGNMPSQQGPKGGDKGYVRSFGKHWTPRNR